MTAQQLLCVKDLVVSVEDGEILHGVNLEINRGETHVLMAVSYTHLTLPTKA